MIKLNLENAVTKAAIEKYRLTVKKIATKMESLETKGYDFLGWKDLPENYNRVEFKEIKRIVKDLVKKGVDTLVVVGIGGSFAGAKAAIDMIQGEYPLERKMEVVFVGESMSSNNLAQKLAYVENKNFAINVISKSGTTTEPAIAFRLFRRLLEEKVGEAAASQLIIATTDANKGTLLRLAVENSYRVLEIPDNIGGRFSVLTAVGLFPMACAGIDIKKVMVGAQKAHSKYASDLLDVNDAYKYAVSRFILHKKFGVELMVQYESQMKAFSEWWKQLAGESEGKERKGLFPASAVFSTDLHSLGQFIQEGSKVLFETTLTVKTPNADILLTEFKENTDQLNYLSGKTIHDVNNVIFEATTDAHVKFGKVPNINIEIQKLDEENFGELVIFFQRAIAMSAYLLNLNPFDQPGVEVYKQNMFKQLGK